MEPIELTHYTFDKDTILSAPKDERHLFLLNGHLLNELNVLVKLFIWSYRYHSREQTLAMGGLANQGTTIAYFISKIFEGWKLVNKRFTPSLQGIYIPCFSPEAKTSYDELKRYFRNGKNSMYKVRNNFGFHNHDDNALLLKAFNEFPAVKYDIFLNDDAPGLCLFHISELAFSLGLARVVDEDIQTVDQYKHTFPNLVEEMIRIHKHLQNVLLGFQTEFVSKYLKGKCESKMEKITPEAKFEDIRIPYFVYPPTSDLENLN